jgi:hypothetical protein
MNSKLSCKYFRRGLATLCMGMFLSAASMSQAAVVACGSSPLDITLSYDVTTAIDQSVDNILSYNQYVCNAGGSGLYTVSAGGSTFADYFPKSSSNAPLSTLQLGVTHDLPGDTPGQQHLVLMVDNAWAAASAGISFGTLFSGASEDDVIAALNAFADFDTTNDDAASQIVGGFAFGPAISAFYNLGAVVPGATTTSDFTVFLATNGQIIGTGIASLTTALPDNNVPIPGTLFLLASGLLALVVRPRKA